jgi:Phage integrase, N-terminal SAM-like domain
MDPLGRDPLVRSFERHLYAENRSARTVTTYLIAVRQADAFLRGRGTSMEAATRADLEAFMADLLARRTANTAATYHKVLKILDGWLAEEEEIPANPMAKIKRPIVPEKPVPIVPEETLSACSPPAPATPSRADATPPAHAAAGHRRPPGRDGRAQARRCRLGARCPAGAGQGLPRATPWNQSSSGRSVPRPTGPAARRRQNGAASQRRSMA